MSEFVKLADALESALNLGIAPIAVTVTDTLPEGINEFAGKVAAGCSFWQEAATKTFATTASDHQSCAIGIHTHNLSGAPTSQSDELQTTLKAMMGLDYIRPHEVAAIPTIAQARKYVIYGPLAQAQTEPDVVLLFAQAQQGLILTEAVERVDQALPAAMGRPACAVVPQAINKGQAVMSLGCCGARAYLEMLTDVVALWALPAFKLTLYVEQIVTLARANTALTQFHQARKSDIEAGNRPSVAQTLKIFE